MYQGLIKLFIACLVTVIVGCGAGSDELSSGDPLHDALARFNMAVQSGDEATALELMDEDERALVSDDGFGFSDKYRKGAKRLRLSTLMNNKELGLNDDGQILGLHKVLEESNTKSRHSKINKRLGLSAPAVKESPEPLEALHAADQVNTTEEATTEPAESVQSEEAQPIESKPIEDGPVYGDIEETPEPQIESIEETNRRIAEAQANKEVTDQEVINSDLGQGSSEMAEEVEESVADEDGFVEF